MRRTSTPSPFLRTVYEWWDDDLLDAEHPARLEMAEGGIDRLILAEIAAPDPDSIAGMRPNADANTED